MRRDKVGDKLGQRQTLRQSENKAGDRLRDALSDIAGHKSRRQAGRRKWDTSGTHWETMEQQ